MLLVTALMSYTGRRRDDGGMDVGLVGLYWHFVDIVWIVIFTVVYLLQVCRDDYSASHPPRPPATTGSSH